MIQDPAAPVTNDLIAALGGGIGIAALITAVAALITAIAGCVKAFRAEKKATETATSLQQLTATVNARQNQNQTMVSATTAHFHITQAAPSATAGAGAAGQDAATQAPYELSEAPAANPQTGSVRQTPSREPSE
jgi:hypothetical protein